MFYVMFVIFLLLSLVLSVPAVAMSLPFFPLLLLMYIFLKKSSAGIFWLAALIGLLLDLIQPAPFGLHAFVLVLTLFIFYAASNFFRRCALLLQCVLVLILVYFYMGVYDGLLRLLQEDTAEMYLNFWPFLTMIAWPFVFLILRFVDRKVSF